MADAIGVRRLTRDNFHAVGRWAQSDDYWPLHAPRPALFWWSAPHAVRRAHLGDIIVKCGTYVLILHRRTRD